MNETVTDTAAATAPYVEAYRALSASLNGKRQGWLHARREDAFARFRTLGLPTTHEEAWRYTSLTSLAVLPETQATATPPTAAEAASLLALPACGLDTPHGLVFVDGQLVASASKPLQAGLARLLPLATALSEIPAVIEAYLARVAAMDGDGLAALNTAFLTDAAVLHLPPGAKIDQPLRISFLSRGRTAAMQQPRLLVVAEAGSEAQIVEIYTGAQGAYATNAVTEIVMGAGAKIAHVRLQDDSRDAHHLGLTAVRVATGSHYALLGLHRGASVARHEVQVHLDGEGAHATLDSLSVASGTQHTAQRTVVEHRSPGASSEQLHKSVLDGRATSVFDGLVRVHRDAQKTQARQTSRGLLLSKTATANAKPQLEIYADDVKCNHGATVGQLDAQALFYLLSRGLPDVEARQMLIEAFATDVLTRLPTHSTHTWGAALLGRWFAELAEDRGSR